MIIQRCLDDVHLAIKLNYPTNLQYKLMQRAGQCYLYLGKCEDASRGMCSVNLGCTVLTLWFS